MMNSQFKQNGVLHSSNGSDNINLGQVDSFEGNKLSSLVEWLNGLVPQLHLPLDASEEDLRVCLLDGAVLCTILNKLDPLRKEMQGKGDPGSASIKRFLEVMDEIGLTKFEESDLDQGHMVAVLKCLDSLRTNFSVISESGGIQVPSKKQWNLWELVENLRTNQGCNGDFSDLLKSSNLNNASTQLLFSVVNRILSEIVERKNGDIAHSVAFLLQKIIEVIEGRVYSRAENIKNQSNLYRAREEKYQSRLRALESLAKGTIEENEVVFKQLEQIKIEKTRLEEGRKLEEQDVLKLRNDKVLCDAEVARLSEELELAKRTLENQHVQLEAQFEMSKIAWEKKSKELEGLLMDSRKKVKDVEVSYESKDRRDKMKERTYQNFVDKQSLSLQALKEAFQSVKHDIMRTKWTYLDAFNSLGAKLRPLTDVAENYHSVLEENRRLYNEVQDLKGNIRVYCRVRPFLPGQSKKQTTIEYIGENGELVVANPLKQGKENHRLFKFNKVFGPQATQEQVFLDTQPLIRSVLDGYNVCIFAYGQTGSGKTYTMSGPNIASRQDWGVNYRALNDLFEISQIRQSSILYEIGVQMVEIYNEQVRDLLIGDGSQRRLGIWSTTQPNGLAVPEASMHSVKSTEDVLELMHIGLMNRAVGATALNERSSRSHSILTVHVRGTDLKTNAVLRGSLHLVDLAGSERVDRSEVTGDRLREAQHINKSLSALGDVIFALSQNNTHVPYRNSKLTQVLHSSLGGQAKTLMFVQLNPDVESYSETISTLKFAERVSGVELGAARSNKEGREVRELVEQVTFLKDCITKKDEEIERLQLVKGNANGIKGGMSALRNTSSSPRNHSPATPREGRSLSRGRGSNLSEKTTGDIDNSSECSERHSDVGSHPSADDARKIKEHSFQSNPVVSHSGMNSNEDIELLGFGDADSEERLSDISDSVLSLGTETDGSVSSIVEYTLFPEAPKASQQAEKVGASSKVDIVDKSKFQSKLPKPTQRSGQTKTTRLSLQKNTSAQLLLSKSAPKLSSGARKLAGGSSSAKPPKRWQ